MDSKLMKWGLVALAACLTLAACGPQGGGSSASSAPEPASSVQASEPASQSQESQSQAASATAPAPGDVQATLDGLTLSCPQLGFTVQVPALLEGKGDTAVTTTELYGETVTTVVVSYVSATSLPVLLLDEMSTGAWEKMKAEGGPVGVELGTSKAGRVVVMNSLQSNPYVEDSEEYTIFQQWPSQLGAVTETFKFTE